jgi:hypothetical protein
MPEQTTSVTIVFGSKCYQTNRPEMFRLYALQHQFYANPKARYAITKCDWRRVGKKAMFEA